MNIRISKADVVWSYIAQLFNVGSGVLVLPLILHMLSTDEIALYYLLMTIGSMAALVDFGFSPQLGRFISYVFSGSQQIEKEGLSEETESDVNYHLLKCLIEVAKRVYMYMSSFVLIFMITLGTWYIYNFTNGFITVPHAFPIWIIFSFSTFFNIYFCYYLSLVFGRGQIQEAKKASMSSRIVYIILAYIFLLCDFGLLGVCIASFLSPFVCRWISYRYFYDENMKKHLQNESVDKKELSELFAKIWYNAKKLGVGSIGGFAAVQFSMFFAGIYLTSEEISSYGLMMQLVGIIASISVTFNSTMTPQLVSLKVNNEKENLIRKFSFVVCVYYILFLFFSCIIVFIVPKLLILIQSNANLPSSHILLLYLVVIFLENNHSLFANYISLGNTVPYIKASIISGSLICLGGWLVLKYTNCGLFGLVIVQGVIQLLYNNWYWPRWSLEDMNISFLQFLKIGFTELYDNCNNIICHYLSYLNYK